MNEITARPQNEKKSALTDKEIQDFLSLVGNEVSFSIISAITLYNEPLNLIKLSKMTGYPSSTLSRYIQVLLNKKFIKKLDKENKPKKRGIFYDIDENFLRIQKIMESESETEDMTENFDSVKDMNISDYKLKLLKEYNDKIQNNSFTENYNNFIGSLAMFNQNIAKFNVEYFKHLINYFKEGKILGIDIPLSYVSSQQATFTFANINQLIEFQAIYIKFMKDIIDFKKKISKENGSFDEKKLEKAYLYLYVGPIINITEMK